MIKFKKNGFTLVELLVVITILVILGLAALIGINPLVQIFKGYDVIRKSDIKKIQAAFEAYYEDKGCYPPFEVHESRDLVGNLVSTYTSILNTCGGTALQPYLESIPCDPNSKLPYTNDIKVDDSRTCPQSYHLYTKLTNTFDPSGQYLVDTYMSSSKSCQGVYSAISGMSRFEAEKSCNSQICANGYYGCVEGTCQLVAPRGEFPACKPTYCNSNCSNGCMDYNDNGDLVINEGNRCVP